MSKKILPKWVNNGKVCALLHFEGEDGSTNFVDSSEYERTITVSGTVTHSTAQHKFGNSSLYFNNGYISVDFSQYDKKSDISYNDFSVDFWVYPTSASRQAFFAGQSDFVFGMDYHYNGTRNVNIWAAYATSWNIIKGDSGGTGIGTISLNLNAWNHVAFVREGSNYGSYINNALDVNSRVVDFPIRPLTALRIGIWGNGSYPFYGYIDEFRFVVGEIDDFTVPRIKPY